MNKSLVKIFAGILVIAVIAIGLPLFNGSGMGEKTPVISKNLFPVLNGIVFPEAKAATPYTYYRQLENDLYMLIGYPSSTVYINLTGGNGPPQNGVLGMVKSIGDGVAALLAANGVTSCAAIPSTGTVTGSQTVAGRTVTLTVVYATPIHTIPAGYTGAGTLYQKRIQISWPDLSGSGTGKFGLEWTCGVDAAFAEMSLPAGSAQIGGPTAASMRMINLWTDSSNPANKKTEFMMKVSDTTIPQVFDGQLSRLSISNTGTFNLSTINFYYRGSTYQGYRLGVSGDSSSGATSTTYLSAGALGPLYSNVTGAISDYTTQSPALLPAFSTSFTWNSTVLRGCLDFAAQTDPGSNALCPSKTLSTPAAPLVDATGAFTFDWMRLNIDSKVTMSF